MLFIVVTITVSVPSVLSSCPWLISTQRSVRCGVRMWGYLGYMTLWPKQPVTSQHCSAWSILNVFDLIDLCKHLVLGRHLKYKRAFLCLLHCLKHSLVNKMRQFHLFKIQQSSCFESLLSDFILKQGCIFLCWRLEESSWNKFACFF